MSKKMLERIAEVGSFECEGNFIKLVETAYKEASKVKKTLPKNIKNIRLKYYSTDTRLDVFLAYRSEESESEAASRIQLEEMSKQNEIKKAKEILKKYGIKYDQSN